MGKILRPAVSQWRVGVATEIHETEMCFDLFRSAKKAKLKGNEKFVYVMLCDEQRCHEKEVTITQDQIAELCGISHSTVNSVLDRLEKKGYIRRRPVGNDITRYIITGHR